MKSIILGLCLLSFVALADSPPECNSDYPLNAAEKGIEGYVLMKFSISKEGKPVDIEVINAEPANVFDEVSICSLSKWVYKPKLVDGKPVKQEGLKVQLDWTLE
ncbi:energy transducer TonB [Agaribacter marinus]|uniref:Protein TonB n=1 Tax=Agaribacter marinus TaxID=1431249 RepID=A0AA37WH18_9ALTE|nr:energy transducer TonB [Agaribacter marinus]GLR69393.1 hypothetical protein GCM10007852_03010 [Agaribacter marinus]